MPQPIKVGIRELRSHLPQYLLEADLPFAITRHGETIGYYIPTREAPADSELAALRAAAAKLEKLLGEAGVDAESIAIEFAKRRRRRAK
jgi:antitoxin (DNA-binding transcriptional repressor) of toxin-antitoxin stability system